MKNKILYIPVAEDKFMATNVREEIEAHVKAYNDERLTTPYDIVDVRVERAGNCCCEFGVYEFARALAILQLAREGRLASRIWTLSADIAFASGDMEFCREFAIHEARDGYAAKRFAAVKKESADDNTADIMGMIVEELGANGELSEDDFEELLEDFAAPLVKWRSLKVPKYKDAEAYNAIYETVLQCYEHKAYHTALRMAALLYVTDKKNMPNLINTNILAGKIMLELGYDEAARRCFLFAARDNSKKRRPPFPEEYREFVERETDLEVPEEVMQRQKYIDDEIASGKIKTYTEEEVDKYHDDKLKIDFPDPQKQEKERNKTGEKAIKAYEKHSDGDPEERLKGIDEAFKAFTEEPEVYEQAAYLYFLKANNYLEADDLENAYDCIKKAYKCKNGSINGMVLLTFAVILSKMGRSSEAKVYIFRTLILLGAEFVEEKLGESAIEALEDYL